MDLLLLLLQLVFLWNLLRKEMKIVDFQGNNGTAESVVVEDSELDDITLRDIVEEGFWSFTDVNGNTVIFLLSSVWKITIHDYVLP